MIHISIEFEQEKSPYSYKIHDKGTHIRIRFTEKIEDGYNISVIYLTTDIIYSYKKGYKKDSFLNSSNISAEIHDDFLMIRADMDEETQFAKIPIDIWEMYVALAKKAETPYQKG